MSEGTGSSWTARPQTAYESADQKSTDGLSRTPMTRNEQQTVNEETFNAGCNIAGGSKWVEGVGWAEGDGDW